MAEEEIVNQSSSTTPKKEENNNGDSNNKENVVDPELLVACFNHRAPIPILITSEFVASSSFAKRSPVSVADWIGDAMEKGMWLNRNYIRRPRNWELQTPSHQSTPGNSGRWLPSPSPLSLLYEVDQLEF
ncbi:WD repeat-containing protein 13 [Melia azedarach]|uniref:WD repeat-containing protein 13 n=1 Tax=Melia azedarach TaxID=155640 RepID=A0ACC1Y096_MELAZ|nr:WD repeat-containing protein 13 [Melia azedarach]